jgi:beta-glucosidase
MLAWWGEKFPEHMAAEMAARRLGLDFLGINYYTRHTVRAGGPPPLELTRVDRGALTAMNWEVYPEGLTEVLLRVTRDFAPVPLIVTENGAAYDDEPDASGEISDEDRRRFLELHIAAAADALDAGTPLEGYFAWSLLDNFEWAEGYRRRFGLVRVDYATQERTVKRSGRWYGDLIRAARAQTLA